MSALHGLNNRVWKSDSFGEIFRIVSLFPRDRLPSSWNHSRLAFLSDKGAKTRVIALGDIFTQSIFKSLHERLFRLLKDMPTDGTFDQDKQRERVRVATEAESQRVYSIDMTACTDRFPALIQMLVLA